ncbi:MAG: HlyD family efflux transporter periplasmic adaptor subunit [Magnetococcales bacterium]|nr:HlyD family efflux transporter periplasmic adaptor subunit [Magnetococcales bacterium]
MNTPSNVSISVAEQRFNQCSALLQLELEVRKATTIQELEFVFVNETLRVLPATSLLFWQGEHRQIKQVTRVSGALGVEAKAPYMQWASSVVNVVCNSQQATKVKALTANDVDEKHKDEWNEWAAPYMLWLPITRLQDNQQQQNCGLMLFRKQPWQPGEMALAERLGDTFFYSWQFLTKKHSATNWQKWFTGRHKQSLVLVLLLGVMFVPVSQSVLATATVVPSKPQVITVPMDGVIETIDVKPNMQVKQGDALFHLDDSKLQANKDMAKKALETDQARLFEARQLLLSEAGKRVDTHELEAIIKQREAEYSFLSKQLEKTVVYSQNDGLALFDNIEDFQGKPVQTGEKILTLANPAQVELKIQLPMADLIDFKPGSQVVMFFNIDPLTPVAATLQTIAYDAVITPDGLFAYPLTATFTQGDTPRIGLRGTAKIIGKQTSLFNYLFRRPLAWLRQTTGL